VDPVDALIGFVLIGFGTVILYGAVKNRKVFGAGGIVSQALATGSIVKASDVPRAFEETNPGAAAAATEKATSSATKLQAAINDIRIKDDALASQIQARVGAVYPDSTRSDLMPLAQLLTIADGKGLASSTAVIRAHVLEVTGESI